MSKPDGQCSVCGEAAVRVQGHQKLCAKHYRFGQMRATAKRRGLYVPTHAELHMLVRDDNRCVDCTRAMVWLGKEDSVLVATLQHYRDGTIALVCLSCNSRHASMPEDTYRDMPKDHKRCPQCAAIKPFGAFAKDNSHTGTIKLKSWCKTCSGIAHGKWQQNNREHYNAKQREGRANRKSLAARGPK